MLRFTVLFLVPFIVEANLQLNSSGNDNIAFENLKAVVEKQSMDINFLQDKMKVLEERNNRLLDECRKITSERSSHHRSERNVGDRRTQAAFYARSEDLSDLGKDQIVVFKDSVYINIGNLYNANNGVFYCDTAGIYVFYVRILSERGREVRVYLAKNGSQAAILSAPNAGTSLGSDSNMAIIQLQRGDTVAVKSVTSYSGNVIDSWSTFSGFLLYPETEVNKYVLVL